MALKTLPRDWQANMVKRTNDVKGKKLNLLLWGPEGTGKTYFIRTCLNPFIIATENGLLSLYQYDFPMLEMFNGEYKVYDSIMKVIQSIKRGEIECDTVALDSVWKLNELLKEEIMEETGRDSLQQQDWGTLQSRISNIMNHLLHLDKHFVATCGVALKQSQEDEDLVIPTFNMQGSYKDQMAYEFDFTFFTEKKKSGRDNVYIAHTTEQRNRRAKTRIEIPAKFENPDFGAIVEMMEEQLANPKPVEETDAQKRRSRRSQGDK